MATRETEFVSAETRRPVRSTRALSVDPGMAGVLTASSSPRKAQREPVLLANIGDDPQRPGVGQHKDHVGEAHAIGLGHVFFFNRAGERSADFDA